ncbi:MULTISPECIES: M2 family metallopeptidase [unclassified Novosphingobium]|uniref:M2 family metallopeptidase n=1 Tax=unclassified Novosphingobium TaxID=2644732 RepID=UPI00061CD8A2|nr:MULTISPECIES: M2 family metallopeptidase [unclassified Novosphingobium]MBF5088682.1 M2 family metallopeptidase [Novosphingobium sp. NBM11]QCI92177.1 peptidase M2 family protein [Novosphingobium sp. EMRT-2]RQW44646.1 peptidase M2 family protein [Novosphingobium sp. LASN5T]GAO56293.1 peptidyl-dipeptidase A precursor [Novosphingobium sp. MD-1]
MKSLSSVLALAVAGLSVTGLAAPACAQDAAATPATVKTWLSQAEKDYFDQSIRTNRTEWVYQTNITYDTAELTSAGNAALTKLQVDQAKQAAILAKVPGLAPDVARKLLVIRTQITTPAPTTPGAAEEFAALQARVQGIYGKGHGTLNGEPVNGSDIEEAMGTTRDPAKLKEMWVSWHDTVGTPMKADYVRMVDIANAGARELGFADTGALWRSNYDMDPDAFAALTEKIWGEVQPLYRQLHCYVRTKLNEKYGDAVQPRTGPIRADLLGNMWAQEWGNIYDIVAPAGAGDLGYDVTDLLAAKGYDPLKMVKAGEGFYSSLGLAQLPETFWQRSQFVKPRDREVVCHASAWDVDNKDDLRIKMCIKVNGDDFGVIHHELGHNYYQRAYNGQDPLYLNGANDGFHEAIGDFVALSITPEYLVQIGLLDRAKVPGPEKDTGLLLRQAMDKVAFLPFGLLIDRWRWNVFNGTIKPAQYETAWNDMRLKYQGIVPPAPRSADAFDPGAKYHIPAVVPYTRYFLARVLQFQFFEAACKQAGWKGPLHRCSFYGNKAVGQKLNAMLTMGASKPWPDALEAFTGSREMSGASMVRYFAPLSRWLEQQNRGKDCGW